MAKIIPLCSSSKGNSTLLCIGATTLLIDIGCSFRSLNAHLCNFGYSLSDISALLITHEHTDHVKGLHTFIKRTDIPVFATRGTVLALAQGGNVHSESSKAGFSAFNLSSYICDDFSQVGEAVGGSLNVKCFNTPHDAAQSVGFVVENNDYTLAYCTDLGQVTDEVKNTMVGSDAVFLESNYCPEMLQTGGYPYFLKKRIDSCVGHLSNRQSAEFSAFLVSNGTKRIILGHLSQQNNTPRTAHNCHVQTLASHGIRVGVDCLLDIAAPVADSVMVTL
ncbi:MAG: MBL fold metallo-hydrolase [Oscillospiraceae bacterium]|nr:MBL fold metallo-hydrolase [Oscillospiraceae bacterium]